MNKYLVKIGLFFTFCIISVAIIACSDEFVISMMESEPVAINTDIGLVSDFVVKEGYTDSLTYYVSGIINPDFKDFKLLDENGNDQTDFAIENVMKRNLKFKVEWNAATDAATYEVRVNKNPITEKNWKLSPIAEFQKDSSSTGSKIVGDVIVKPRPEIKTGKCTGCGECKEKCPVDAITIENGKSVINYENCIECGECYRACEFDAVDGVFAGTAYYFAIRAVNDNDEYSDKIYCSPDAYKMRYSSLASIPDEAKVIDYGGKPTQAYVGCAGNCRLEGCYIVFPTTEFCKPFDSPLPRGENDTIDPLPSVCPVDAIYQYAATDSIKESKSIPIYIDKDKCINCGRCVGQCYANGKQGAIVTEIIKIKSRFFK